MGDCRNGAGNDVADAIPVFGECVGALGLADLLHDHLARSLRRDTSKPRGGHLDFNRLTLCDRLSVICADGSGNGDKARARILVGSH